MSIWASIDVNGDEVRGCDVGYQPGDDVWWVDVAVNGAWNNRIRLLIADDDCRRELGCMLTSSAARLLAARLVEAADYTDQRWPA